MQPSDLLETQPGCRMPLVEATRKWRKGVRTYVAFEQPVHSEMSIAKAVMVSLLVQRLASPGLML